MHKTVDSNKGNGCQICSWKTDLLAAAMNNVKKMNIVFSCVDPMLKWNVVRVIILPLIASFEKQCLS